jgi:hypothetical protein
MAHKQKKYSPQDYIHLGIAFFLLALFVSVFTDGRMLGIINTSLLHDKALVDFVHGFVDGLIIPFSCVSIFFNVRGLYLLRCQNQSGIEE